MQLILPRKSLRALVALEAFPSVELLVFVQRSRVIRGERAKTAAQERFSLAVISCAFLVGRLHGGPFLELHLHEVLDRCLRSCSFPVVRYFGFFLLLCAKVFMPCVLRRVRALLKLGWQWLWMCAHFGVVGNRQHIWRASNRVLVDTFLSTEWKVTLSSTRVSIQAVVHPIETNFNSTFKQKQICINIFEKLPTQPTTHRQICAHKHTP